MSIASQPEQTDPAAVFWAIKAQLRLQGITVKQLAKAIGRSPAYTSNVIRGLKPLARTTPTRQAIEKFLNANFWSNPTLKQ